MNSSCGCFHSLCCFVVCCVFAYALKVKFLDYFEAKPLTSIPLLFVVFLDVFGFSGGRILLCGEY